MEADPTRAGVLLIRAWVEQESTQRLRVRLMCQPSSEGGQTDVYLASAEEVVRQVTEWLDQLMRDGRVADE